MGAVTAITSNKEATKGQQKQPKNAATKTDLRKTEYIKGHCPKNCGKHRNITRPMTEKDLKKKTQNQNCFVHMKLCLPYQVLMQGPQFSPTRECNECKNRAQTYDPLTVQALYKPLTMQQVLDCANRETLGPLHHWRHNQEQAQISPINQRCYMAVPKVANYNQKPFLKR